MVPLLPGPAGVALDAGSEDGGVLFPPVAGIVPDAVAVDLGGDTMSGESPDLHVPPEALAEIAKGIDLAHAELKDLGFIGQATTGRGFSELALSGLE